MFDQASQSPDCEATIELAPSEVTPDCIAIFAAENGISVEEAKSLLGIQDQECREETSDDSSEIDTRAYFLMESFPELPLEKIQDALRQCQGDEGKTVELLLNEIFLAESEPNDPATTDKSQSKKKARMSKKDKTQLTETQQIANLSDGLGMSFNQAARLYKSKGNLTDALFSTVPAVTRAANVAPAANSAPAAKPRTRLESNPSSNMSAREIKRAYNLHTKRAEELRNQLQESRASGDLKATHNRHLYQDKTSQIYFHTQKAHELSLELTQMHHSRLNHYSVDFHQLTVKEAEAVAHKQLDKWLDSSEQELVLITGLGSHSQNGVARIKPAIEDLLRMRRIRYIDQGGSLVAIK